MLYEKYTKSDKKYVEKIYEHIDIPNKSKNNVDNFFQVKGIYLVEIRV